MSFSLLFLWLREDFVVSIFVEAALNKGIRCSSLWPLSARRYMIFDRMS